MWRPCRPVRCCSSRRTIPMDMHDLVAMVRPVASRPSRRDVGRGLAGLVAGTILGSLVRLDQTEAGGKGGGKKKKKKKKKKKSPPPPPEGCPSGTIWCVWAQTCCRDVLCQPGCGCCTDAQPVCCGDNLTQNHFCYDPNAETCCPKTAIGLVGACPRQTVCAPPLGDVPFCCESGSDLCHATYGCCPPGQFCCAEGVCCDNVACQPAPDGDCFPKDFGDPARIG